MRSERKRMFQLTISVLSVFLCVAQLSGGGRQESSSGTHQLKLEYSAPAARWEEALPIGNGRQGAMVFGGVEVEHLQLNESSLYSGDPTRTFDDISVRKELDRVVSLLRQGEYTEAQEKPRFGRLLVRSRQMKF